MRQPIGTLPSSKDGGSAVYHSLLRHVSPQPSLPAGEGRSKKRKRGSGGPAGGGGLSVPVICTANDAYAPCLRPLRDIAAVYHFKPPAADKLAARLGAIAAAEGLGLDKQVGGVGGGERGCGQPCVGCGMGRQGAAPRQSFSCGGVASEPSGGSRLLVALKDCCRSGCNLFASLGSSAGTRVASHSVPPSLSQA